MSDELDGLLARVNDPALRADLTAQVERLRAKRTFGLVFESHLPERVRLPEHPIRAGVKVASRDDTDSAAFQVVRIHDGKATIRKVRHPDGATLSSDELAEVVDEERDVDALVVIADFGEPVYPGLRRLGSVDRGGDKPVHIAIKGENHHVLEAMQFTHAGKVDCIYIDPPYNTGARDWKYDNNYVDDTDAYRHSKWLAFIERRLLLAKELLNPDSSVLIVTIDEKEYLRLGLLLGQTFPEARIQMVSSVIKAEGTSRQGEFSRTNEFVYFVRLGSAAIQPEIEEGSEREIPWRTLRRTDFESRRGTSKGGPSQFYPIYVDRGRRTIEDVGLPLKYGKRRDSVPEVPGCDAVFPIRPDGTEMNWSLTRESLLERLKDGYVRVGMHQPDAPQTYVISYLKSGAIRDIEAGVATVVGQNDDGSVRAVYQSGKDRMPTTVWTRVSHDAQRGGTGVLKSLLPHPCLSG
ncbi:MAG TPA: DNA methyltransferase [Acidimicrobiales bacterium]|nr:DNA methyltransferase [Acidimicrobiales bacterium]